MKIKWKPNFTVKFLNKKGKPLSLKTHSKRKILTYTRRFFGSNGDLRVYYGKDVTNSGEFNSLEHFERVLDSWTDAQMKKYITEGEW